MLLTIIKSHLQISIDYGCIRISCKYVLYIKLSHNEQALEDLNKILEVNPDNIKALETCVEIYYLTKDYKNALVNSNKLLEYKCIYSWFVSRARTI